ncbi:N-acetylmuramidase domain-containing protein [Mesorhizobium sp. J428]|uniref:N-acetylmuramidase domain-containing protein n=1 Tax=Mesorhizobium sp. J428 TaxID=2898440 RepID=UPI002151FDBE|nr:N-acetylmuramidase domain-containing protein [Mesorhizobium sp. J428]MCR5855976.1 N-acetylmuramidase domain-containing protein [Mesorhizobium sp. J428]
MDAETRQAATAIANAKGWEPPALLAVIEIESAGKVFATVNGRKEPMIRFEGHYFDRRLPADKRAVARKAGLASPTAGAVKNPASQAARWAMLNRAIEIDATAALESVSWGLGQVMGSHWEWLGYSSVGNMVNVARSGVSGQIDLMVRYIEKAGLSDELARRDWAGFARGYNGPNYKKYGYDTKLAAAYRRQLGSSAPVAPSTNEGLLRMGSKGDAVRDLQTLLRRAGHAIHVDGDFGPATRDAVRAFQTAAGLDADGIAGPATLAALDRYRQSASPAVEKPSGWLELLLALLRSL